VDVRLAAAPVVTDLARALECVVVGLYVGGSLATGDYRPGVSDIDAVALMERSPNPATRSVLAQAHQRLAREVDGGSALHCVYIPSTDAADVTLKQWTWAFGELFRRPLSGIARAELLADPIVVAGPDPSSWLAPIARMADRGLPHEIVDGIARRRRGQQVPMREDQRQDRAWVVRAFLTDEIARLLAPVHR